MEQNSKKVIYDYFVTGSTGFIGKAFLERVAQDRKIDVLLGCRALGNIPQVQRAMSHQVICDLSKPLSLPISARVVVHMAAEKQDAALMQAVNVEGTRRLLKWSAESGVRRFVYLSSVGTYGAGYRAGMVRVGQVQTPGNSYERTKKAAEELVRDVCERAGMQWSILQPSNVIGINSRSRHPLLGLIRAVKSGYFVYMSSTISFVNYVAVEDVTESLMKATCIEMPGGTFIINTPAPLTDFIECIATELRVPSPRRHLPKILAAGMGAIFSIVTPLMSRPMPFSMEKFRELSNRTIYDGTDIEKALDFRYPVGWRRMLHELISTYHQMGLL